MNNKVIRVLSRQKYNVGALQTQSSIVFRIGSQIDVSQYREITLCARLHAWNFKNGAQAKFTLYDDGYTDEDPTANSIRTLTTITFATGENDPLLKLATIDSTATPLVHFVSVYLTLTQGTQTTNYYAILSADLILRS